ncbi:hypothetical protein SKAU_G00219660 [Synaphobranchus kaupii]|uniref:Uncharacterized protein n=1 Tax=Synaphobranchus kaupii TaxID=118154 RepID=A0A9Q1FAD5_SYNKA|nr:hypothetical protein SKAU_G00219660 [Synaphobranchus kaupii]
MVRDSQQKSMCREYGVIKGRILRGSDSKGPISASRITIDVLTNGVSSAGPALASWFPLSVTEQGPWHRRCSDVPIG